MPSVPDPRVCSIEAALRVIGEKWSLLVVRELMSGCTKYAEIVHNTGVPRDILTRRLRSLERSGIIYRHLYNEQPPRYDYRLAEAGEQLHGLLVMLRHWGDVYARNDPENTATVRHDCTAKLKPELRCADCGEVLHPGSVTSDRELRRSELSVGVDTGPVPDTDSSAPESLAGVFGVPLHASETPLGIPTGSARAEQVESWLVIGLQASSSRVNGSAGHS